MIEVKVNEFDIIQVYIADFYVRYRYIKDAKIINIVLVDNGKLYVIYDDNANYDILLTSISSSEYEYAGYIAIEDYAKNVALEHRILKKIYVKPTYIKHCTFKVLN